MGYLRCKSKLFPTIWWPLGGTKICGVTIPQVGPTPHRPKCEIGPVGRLIRRRPSRLCLRFPLFHQCGSEVFHETLLVPVLSVGEGQVRVVFAEVCEDGSVFLNHREIVVRQGDTDLNILDVWANGGFTLLGSSVVSGFHALLPRLKKSGNCVTLKFILGFISDEGFDLRHESLHVFRLGVAHGFHQYIGEKGGI